VLAMCLVAADIYAVIGLNGQYPQVTLVDRSMTSGSSSHTTVVVADCTIDQSSSISLAHNFSMLTLVSFNV